jgi:nucleoside-diphosphate-sugar epimerase
MEMVMERILVIGANGQIGSELVSALEVQHSADKVIASDIGAVSLAQAAQYQPLDVLDKDALMRVVSENDITQVYQLAALLSATGEQMPLKAWTLNMDGLLNILEVARLRGEAGKPLRVFWPSSIAAFGPNTPAQMTPQMTVMDPVTIYGISKLAGERLCEYYFLKYGVDVRSIRYPGIISYKSPPGGGTTDYAIAIFYAAKKQETYTCFLDAQTTLPMIYMPDAIRATIGLMDAAPEQVKIRSSYNIAGLSFNPAQLAAEIRYAMPAFTMVCQPDSRQAIAATWPQSLDDSVANADWGWRAEVGLRTMVQDMLKHIDIGLA